MTTLDEQSILFNQQAPEPPTPQYTMTTDIVNQTSGDLYALDTAFDGHIYIPHMKIMIADRLAEVKKGDFVCLWRGERRNTCRLIQELPKVSEWLSEGAEIDFEECGTADYYPVPTKDIKHIHKIIGYYNHDGEFIFIDCKLLPPPMVLLDNSN